MTAYKKNMAINTEHNIKPFSKGRISPFIALLCPVIRAVLFGLCVFLFGITPARAEQQIPNRQSGKAAPPPRIHKSLKQAMAPILHELKVRGLPVEPVLDKAREGIVKGIDDVGIVRACTQLASYLGEARNVLKKPFKTRRKGPKASVPTELMRAYAEARLSGVTRKEIETILSASSLPAGRRMVVSGLYLIADLKISGYPGEETSRIIASLYRNGDAESLELLKGELVFSRKRFGLTKTQTARTMRVALQKYKTPHKAFQSIRRGHEKHLKSSGPSRPSKHSR